MKTLVVIWLAVLVTAIGGTAYVNAEINKLVVNEPFTVSNEVTTPVNPQKTISVYKLQPTVSDASLQWGDNPQKTAPASVLETATEIN